MTSSGTRALVTALCTVALTACATAKRVEMDISAPSKIHKIALLKIAEPSPLVQNVGGMAARRARTTSGCIGCSARASSTTVG